MKQTFMKVGVDSRRQIAKIVRRRDQTRSTLTTGGYTVPQHCGLRESGEGHSGPKESCRVRPLIAALLRSLSNYRTTCRQSII